MPLHPKPVVGGWYRTSDGDRFEVVAVDALDRGIEIQYYGGDIDEIDQESWSELEIESIAPSEDWSAPFDDLERDDLGFTDMNLRPEHGLSVDDLEREEER